MLRICFAGGGSGGHILPNLAIYECQGESNSYFFLPGGELEKRLARQYGFYARFYKPVKLARGNFLARVFKVSLALVFSLPTLLLNRPDCVLGTGGFGSFPVFFWAVLLRIPLYLIEPNSIGGKVNRWFGPYARLIFTLRNPPVGMEHVNWVSSGIPSHAFERHLKRKIDVSRGVKPTLLVFGASQGAQGLNDFVLNQLVPLKKVIDFDLIWIQGVYHKTEMESMEGVRVFDYYDRIEELYSESDLILCRSGAGTVNEIRLFRVPAVFVPYPYHNDRQQFLNCEDLVESGSCLLVEEEKLAQFQGEMQELLNSPERIESMKSRFPEQETESVAQRILKQITKDLD